MGKKRRKKSPSALSARWWRSNTGLLLAWMIVFAYGIVRHCQYLLGDATRSSGVVWLILGIALSAWRISHRSKTPDISLNSWWKARESYWPLLGLLLGFAGYLSGAAWLAVIGWSLGIRWIVGPSYSGKLGSCAWLLVVVAALPSSSVITDLHAVLVQRFVNLASRILDQFGILHLITGDSIRLIYGTEQYPIGASTFLSPFFVVGSTCLICTLLRLRLLHTLAWMVISVTLTIASGGVRVLLIERLAALSIAPSTGGLFFDSLHVLLLVSLGGGMFGLIRITLSPLSKAGLPFPDNRWLRVWNSWTVGYADHQAPTRSDRFSDSTAESEALMSLGGGYRFFRNYVSALTPTRASALTLILGSLFITTVWYARRDTNANRLVSVYRLAFADALREERFTAAETAALRLETFSVDRSETLRLVQSLFLAGQSDRAMNHLHRLAEHSGQNVPVAALLLAQRYAAEKGQQDKAEKYFQSAIRGMPGRIEPLELYFAYLIAIGSKNQAIARLNQLSKLSPQYAFVQAFLLKQRGNDAGALKLAAELELRLRKELTVSNSRETRTALAQAMFSQRKFAAAIDLLTQPDDWRQDDGYVTAVAMIHIAWARSLIDDELAFANALEKAIKLVGEQPALLSFLAQQIYRSEGWHPNSIVIKHCRDPVDRAVNRDEADPFLLMIVGTGESRNGNYPEAEQLLRRAFDGGMSTPRLLNNLAWTIYQVDPSRSSESLRFVSLALEQAPAFVDALTTRGEVLMHLGRWKEAIDDYEMAVKSMMNKKRQSIELNPDELGGVYGRLSELYKQLGDATTADFYERAMLAEQARVGN